MGETLGNYSNADLIMRYMDREDTALFATEKNPRIHDHRVLIEGFIENNPGKMFTIQDIVDTLAEDDPIGKTMAYQILEELVAKGRVKLLTEKHKKKKYQSNALPPTEPEAGIQQAQTIYAYDDLGKQAREDYNYTINRYRSKKRKYRLITKF